VFQHISCVTYVALFAVYFSVFVLTIILGDLAGVMVLSGSQRIAWGYVGCGKGRNREQNCICRRVSTRNCISHCRHLDFQLHRPATENEGRTVRSASYLSSEADLDPQPKGNARQRSDADYYNGRIGILGNGGIHKSSTLSILDVELREGQSLNPCDMSHVDWIWT